MGFRYHARRAIAACRAFAAVSMPFALFLFPTTRVDPANACFGGREFISFRPLWSLGGLPPDALGLCVEAALAFSLSAGVWVLYPAFRPPPR